MLATLTGRGDAEPQVDRRRNSTRMAGAARRSVRIGEHRLACGIARIGRVVERVDGGRKADMVCTDPPYAIYGSLRTGIGGDVTDDNMVRPFMRITLAGFARLPIWAHTSIPSATGIVMLRGGMKPESRI